MTQSCKATIIHKFYDPELNFVNWYVSVCAEETDTIPVLFSVEIWFHCSGYVNIQHKILMRVPCILYSFYPDQQICWSADQQIC